MSIIPKKILRLLIKIKFKIKFLTLKFISIFELITLRILKPSVGTANWLVFKELEYGGYVMNRPRNIVSNKDPRTKEQISWGGMEGGDRMSKLHQGYAKIYGKYLQPFIQRQKPVVLIEIGVLEGIGVAIWSELFPRSRIIGLDIDLSHIKQNMDNLRKKGAFKNNNLELYKFDQFQDNRDLLLRILKNDKINICIDDGCHFNEAILTTIKSVSPYLAEDFVYFIEDNTTVHEILKKMYPGFKVENFGKITVISPKKHHYSEYRSIILRHDNVLRIGLAGRRNVDKRSYKVLMNASGDSREFAIIPKELQTIAKRLTTCLKISTRPDYIIGFAPGGIPIAMALSYELDVPLIIAYKCRLDLPDEITWSEPHCLFNTFYLYGAYPNMSVILVDDEVDSGNTLYNAIRELQAHGVKILDVACVVEVLHGGYSKGRAKLLEFNLHLKSLCQLEVDKHEK